MSNEEILIRLNTLVGDLLQIDDLQLSRDMTAQDVPGWSSLAHVRIVVAVEQAFGVRFSTSEITSLKTIDDLVKLIDRHSGRR